MASISFTRPSSGTVRYSATGLSLDHEYKIQVYSGGTWYDKVSFTAESTSQSGTFSVDSSTSYSGRLYSVTLEDTLASATIPAYTESSKVTIYAKCDTGVSQFTMVAGSGTYTVYNTDAAATQATITAGLGVTIRSVYPMDGYDSPYILYANIESDINNWSAVTKEFTNSTTLSDTSFDRRIKIGATATDTYPYEQRVYIDETLVTTATNSTNSSSSIQLSDLSNYGYYEGLGNLFVKAVANGVTYTSPAASIPLVKGVTTSIRLYFSSPERAVTPTISNVAVTATTAAVYWSKNGGTYGSWQLYYGKSTDGVSLWGTITSSPVTLTGLSPGTSYDFKVRNYYSATDAKESTTYTAKTKNDLQAFSWTEDDATNIAAGQPAANITASAWNTLMSLINQARAANGLAETALPTATQGGALTAGDYNTAATAIGTLNGAGTVASATQGGTVKATLFANDTNALKEAINRAVDSANA